MKIRIVQPHQDYPLAWVYVESDSKRDDPQKFGFDLATVLNDRRITIIGPLEGLSTEGSIVTMRGPVLLEEEHTKPPKKRTRKK